MKKDKVIVIGLDGSTWKVLNPLIKKGKVPFIKSLIDKGTSGILESTIPPLTPPAWTSFQTGVHPEKHKIFGFLTFKDSRSKIVSSQDIKSKKIWELFGQNSLKSLVINMPVTYPVKRINGVLVSSFLTPKGKKYTHPAKIQTVLTKMKYQIDILIGDKYGELPHKNITEHEKKRITHELIEIGWKRVKAFKTLYNRSDFDFSFLLFKETDIAQHLFFGKKEIENYYVEQDKMIKELYKTSFKKHGKNLHMCIVSDHGFHKTATLQFSPYVFLKSKSFLSKSEKTSSKKTILHLLQKVNNNLKKKKVNITDNKYIKWLRKTIVSSVEEESVKQYEDEQIKILPEGIYSNSLQRSEVTKIAKALRACKYKNKKVFKSVSVIKKSEKTDSLNPAILWIPNEQFSINLSPITTKLVEKRHSHVIGDHVSDRNGIYIINSSKVNNAKNKKMSIVDIFPLLCYFLNVEIPQNIDGKIHKEMIKEKKALVSLSFSNKVEKNISEAIGAITNA